MVCIHLVMYESNTMDEIITELEDKARLCGIAAENRRLDVVEKYCEDIIHLVTEISESPQELRF